MECPSQLTEPEAHLLARRMARMRLGSACLFPPSAGWNQRCALAHTALSHGCRGTLPTRSLPRPICQLLLSYIEFFFSYN